MKATSKVEEQSCHIENRLLRYLRYVCSSLFSAQRLYAYEIKEEGWQMSCESCENFQEVLKCFAVNNILQIFID